jgi:F-type H+-transporting ATPase subunit epsilon
LARLEVHLVTPEREIWTGDARMVIARGVEGEVGILGGHAPLLIQLGIGPLFIQTDDERIAVAVDGGFMHVISEGDESRVDVLAEHADLANEIDRSAAEELRRRAEELLNQDSDDEEAAAKLAMATTRLDLLQ